MIDRMKLTLLGTGTYCSANRGAAANYLEIGGLKVLADFGSGGLRQLARAKVNYDDIDMAFFSHIHTDHILDLAALLQASYWTPGVRRTKPLTLVGPAGFKNYFESYIRPISELPRPEAFTFAIKVIEIEQPLTYPGFTVDFVHTRHDPENASVAYKFTEGAVSLVISGDCLYDQKLIDLCADSDLLLLECSCADGVPSTRHLHASECGEIARQAHAKQLILTHLHPTSSERLRLSQARKIFPNTRLASELMQIDL